MKNEALRKFYSKLRWEGFLRAFLCGLAIGFAVLLYSTTICWFYGFKGIWLSIVLFVVAVAVATSLFYFLTFSPNTKKTAKRIDELGLEERIITMTELEGDNSFIAVKQREDAMSALGKLNTGALKLAVSVPVILTCVIFGLFATSMTALHALNVADVVPSGVELIQGEQPEVFYNIAYSVNGKGVIYGVYNGDKNYIGEEIEIETGKEENKDSTSNKNKKKEKVLNVKVKAGEKSEAVIAVADEGYVFVGWSDGYASPFRTSTVINENKIYTAVFQAIPDVEEEENIGNGGNTDSPSDVGSLKTSGEESRVEALKLAVGSNGNSAVALAGGGGGGAGGGFIIGDPGPYAGGGGGNGDGDHSEPGEPGDGDGASWQDNSASKQIINGKTYYGDVFEEYYKDALAYMDSEDVPEYLKKIIKDYFDTIEVEKKEEDVTIKP